MEYGGPEIGTSPNTGAAHHVISGTKDVSTWLCEVTSIGAASGDGNTMLKIVRELVGGGHCCVDTTDSVEVTNSVVV